MILINNLTMMKFLSRLHVQIFGDSHSGCKRKREVIAPRSQCTELFLVLPSTLQSSVLCRTVNQASLVAQGQAHLGLPFPSGSWHTFLRYRHISQHPRFVHDICFNCLLHWGRTSVLLPALMVI